MNSDPMTWCSLLVLLLCALGTCQTRTLEKRDLRSSEEIQKRPFCNAFTGCGRKRSPDGIRSSQSSNTVPIMPLVPVSPTGLLDAEFLTRLSRRIVAEARLWELLQQRLSENVQDELQTNTPTVLDMFRTSSRKRRSIFDTPQFPPQ